MYIYMYVYMHVQVILIENNPSSTLTTFTDYLDTLFIYLQLFIIFILNITSAYIYIKPSQQFLFTLADFIIA